MQNTVENAEEYKISKCLLLHYLRSKEVSNKVVGGNEVIQSVVDFLNERIFLHENRYCNHLKKDFLHYNVYTNNGVEGLQNGVRHSVHRVTALTALPLATKRIVDGELDANNRKHLTTYRNAVTVVSGSYIYFSN